MIPKNKSKGRSNATLALSILSFLLLAFCTAALLLLIYGADSPSSNQTPLEAFGLKGSEKSSDDYVTFMDVGEGDCIFVTSNGETALIDVGPLSRGTELCAKLRSIGVKQIDRLLITHFHEDHIGALPIVCDRFEVSQLIMPNPVIAEESDNTDDVLDIKSELLSDGKSVITAAAGKAFSVGKFKLSILMCDLTAKTENNRSVITRLDCNGTGFLLMSDAARASEKKLIELNANLSCDVLKVGHHGAKSSTTEELLACCKPEISVISCGADNDYGHPASAVLNRLDNIKSQIYRTDISGDITAYVTENGIEIVTPKPHN